MAKVKGSPQYAMRVVAYRPRLRLLKLVLLGIGALLLLGAAYWFGGERARDGGLTPDQAEFMRTEVDRLTVALNDNQQQLTQAQMNAEVDRKAGEDLRQQLLARREQIAQLERDVNVYRMMSARSSRNPLGISFGKYSISAIKNPDNSVNGRLFHLKLVLQKLAEGEEEFSGRLRCLVVGLKDGKEQKLSLPAVAIGDLALAASSGVIPVSFKYFENIETDLQLPEGFEPQRLELNVEANSSGNPLVIAQELEWARR